ncbi:MAG: sugar phosphate isomerase/epimerase family protein [Bryobacteraceae bacterium]
MQRRTFLALAALAARAPRALHATARGMQLHLSCSALGIQASQREAIDLAAAHGFDAVDADGKYLNTLPETALGELSGYMREKKIVWAMAGLPVEFRRDEAAFSSSLAQFPAYARGLRRAGVGKVTSYVLPRSDSLTYLANFKLHVTRLREIARVLGDAEIRFGIEYVAPKTLWASGRYPFLHTIAEARDLIAEINRPNVGLVLDSWHWYHAGDTAAEIAALPADGVVSVDLNDAPAGVPKDQMVDNHRELPAATGVIDIRAFLGALEAIGFHGPIRAEPFNEAVRKMPPQEAAAAAAAALRKALGGA